MLKGAGFSDADLRKPLIGVANTWIEIGPCNLHLRTLAEDVKAGGQKVAVHGWCYGLKDGLAKDLGVSMSRPDEVMSVFRDALKRYPRA